MIEITIFALDHRVVSINKEAIKMTEVDPSSEFSHETTKHGGCSILVDKVQNEELKKELEELEIHLKKQNGYGTVLACLNKAQK